MNRFERRNERAHLCVEEGYLHERRVALPNCREESVKSFFDFFGILDGNGNVHQRFLHARCLLRDRGVLRVLVLASPRAHTVVDGGWSCEPRAFCRLPDSGGLALCRPRVRGVWRRLHCQLPPVAADRGRHLARQVGHDGGAHLSARCVRHSLGAAGVRRVPPSIDLPLKECKAT